MTKKHFKAIAEAIKDVYEYQKENDGKGSKKIKQGAIRVVSESIADTLQNFNPLFNKEKFLLACGIEQVCKFSGETFPCEVCPKDGMGNCVSVD